MYKWVPANLMLGVTLRWTSLPSRKEEPWHHCMTSSDVMQRSCFLYVFPQPTILRETWPTQRHLFITQLRTWDTQSQSVIIVHNSVLPSLPQSNRDFKRLINFKSLTDNNQLKQYFLLLYYTCMGADLKLILQNMLILSAIHTCSSGVLSPGLFSSKLY